MCFKKIKLDFWVMGKLLFITLNKTSLFCDKLSSAVLRTYSK